MIILNIHRIQVGLTHHPDPGVVKGPRPGYRNCSSHLAMASAQERAITILPRVLTRHRGRAMLLLLRLTKTKVERKLWGLLLWHVESVKAMRRPAEAKHLKE